MAAKFTFGKQERLSSNLAIQDLLASGQTVSGFPLKIYWKPSDDLRQKFPAKVAISVPRRKFKKAVDRNLMKRRIREAYRLNKDLIYDPLREKELCITMIILFLSDEFISFERLDENMRDMLRKLAGNFT